jgi:uncharacterized protein
VALICDTGPLYAAMDRRDEAHEACAELLGAADEALVIPAPVVVELEWLVESRLGHAPFDAFLESVEEGEVEIEALTVADYRRARALCARYHDLPLGFVDAAVIAVAERFKERKVATLDLRHFSVVRPAHVRSLQLVPRS